MIKRWIILIMTAALIYSCTAGPNPLNTGADTLAGFWKGWWHGFIMLFTFIYSLFSDNVTIYEVNNNGGWYNFGYLLGAMTFWSSGHQASNKSRSATKSKTSPEVEA